MREPAGIGSEPGAKIAGRLFERTILQQPGEQQVTLTQRFETLLVALPIRLSCGSSAALFASTSTEATSRNALASSMLRARSSVRT